MERPPSAANSTTFAAATSTHKRTQSGKLAAAGSKSTAFNVVALFVRNVRLLNLDRLPDWPAITASSLNKDARTRIRGAEWCLYQLFHIHDPATTADKLQPFFPPLEPLQSINLRAALYRCLTDLKKNGVLGKDIVLRKSSLDDCQGEKFWELCLSFSAIVLRKVAVDKQNTSCKPAAEQIANAHSLTKGQSDSMLPLAVAHKAALTSILSQKERKRQTYAKLYDVLMDKENDLQQRRMQTNDRPRSPLQEAPIAQEVLEKDWIGSNELRDALRDGDQAAGEDSLLVKSFESVWKANEQDRLFTPDPAELGILEDLEHRAQYQKRRLQRWQNFQERLLSSRPPPSRDSESSAGRLLRFDQHQNLTLRDMVDTQQSRPPAVKHQKHDSVMKYDEILTAMREELRKNSNVARVVPAEPETVTRPRPQSYRQPSITQDAASVVSEHHHRSHSQTAVPVRPPMGKRVSSRSRSYQQPKVISQREPIPLKSEIFSPLKTRRTSTSPTSSGRISVLASPLEEISPNGQIEGILNDASYRMRQNSDYDVSAVAGHSTPTRGSGASTPHSGSENPDSAIELPLKITTAGVAGRNIDGYGRTMRPSLADRTRMSMAFKSSDDLGNLKSEGDRPDQGNTEAIDTPTNAWSSSDAAQTITLDRRSTLHDRTRQSISLVPSHTVPLPSKSKRPSHARSHTAAYPVNQFETPQRPSAPRRSTLTLEVNPGTPSSRNTRNITPREKLFEEDAQYASIFKARPKVALSPVISPFQSEFPVEDDVERSSPLTGQAR